MIYDIIKNNVALMNANGDTFGFLHAEKEWQNIEADEATLPVVYFDSPLKWNPIIKNGGAYERAYIGTLLFLYKTELDDNPTQQIETYNKSIQAQRQLHLLLDKDEDVKALKVNTCYEVRNLFDCNVSGVVMPFIMTTRNFNPVCTP